MSKSKFFGLGVAAVILVLIASLLGEGDQQIADSKLLFPDLKEKLNDVTEVNIQTGDSKVFSLAKDGEVWRMREKQNFPANTATLRKLLLTLADLEVVEEKTSNEKYYERLGVEDIDKAGDQTRLVQVKAGEQVLAHTLIGKNGSGGNSYLRKFGDQSSWLGSARIEVPSRFNAWLLSELLTIKKDRIHSISVTPVEGEAYIAEAAQPKLPLELQVDVGDRKLKQASVDRMGRALDNLSLEDVATEAEIAALSENWNQARFQTFDGLVIEAKTQSLDEKLYLQLAVSYDPSLVQDAEGTEMETVSETTTEPETTTAELVSETDMQPTSGPDVATEAKEAQARVAGYTFVVASYLRDRFAENLDNFFEAAEEGQ